MSQVIATERLSCGAGRSRSLAGRPIKHLFPEPGPAVEPGSETGGKWGESQSPFRGGLLSLRGPTAFTVGRTRPCVALVALVAPWTYLLYWSFFYPMQALLPAT